ncbi:LuxR C-terminal-related transcriptional regulator [Filimonas effusa]|uniref:HTH luxR-type domain-containing protein n=1 Tax=Filimonas effusa TaxID=2508721 RepID=A0A4Q1D101_9BACT|nr:LuxR C-terminal-related transcriptional regulator [Filimonas effusa]RXK80904.1 hypothetical protein ESB13_22375 [Filimonas effusa]
MPAKENELILYNDIKRAWQKISRSSKGDESVSFELEIHKKLINIFHVGQHYYYILNIPTSEMEFVSEPVMEMLGLSSPEAFSVSYVFDHIHPEDRTYFIEFEAAVAEFFNRLRPEQVLKYKVSYDYRMQRTDGTYIRLLQQVTTIQTDTDGAVIRVMGVHTDISHLKRENGSSLSFIGLEGEPSFHNYRMGQSLSLRAKEMFTRREKEIVQLLAQGKTSREIAAILYISYQTVDRHRKNILRKAGLNNSVELVAFALREGWV